MVPCLRVMPAFRADVPLLCSAGLLAWGPIGGKVQTLSTNGETARSDGAIGHLLLQRYDAVRVLRVGLVEELDEVEKDGFSTARFAMAQRAASIGRTIFIRA